MERKSFITNSCILLTGMPFQSLATNNLDNEASLPEISSLLNYSKTEETYKDEEFWSVVRAMFRFPSDYINLENGYFSPQPMSTVQFHQAKEFDINKRTSWFMRVEQQEAVEKTRTALAKFLACDAEELAITRNTTESLNTIISGYPWKKGDEVILGNQDYGSMVAAFEQQAKRYGIVIKTAQIPLHPESDEEVIQSFISLITPKTKILLLTHMINLSGQILPARKIIEAAHAKGVEVMVDAAHSVAQIDLAPGLLDADYVGASLHKWLCNPLGAGILMVKKKHILKIWPLFGDDDFPDDNIRKFQHQGTRAVQTVLSINEAIRFHEAIGSALKEKRLRYLKNYWVNKVKNLPHVTINTPLKREESSCAIVNFSVRNYTPQQLASKLYDEFKIFTVAIDHPHIKGVRVTPHLYTALPDLDALSQAVEKLG